MSEQFTRNHGFRVPEGYFDELPSRIRQRIEQKPPIRSKGIPEFFRRLPPVPALMVLILTFLITGSILLTLTGPRADSPGTEKTDTTQLDLTDYLFVDESTLIEAITGEVPSDLLSFNGNESPGIEIDGSEYTRDEIIEYLMEKDYPYTVTQELTVYHITQQIQQR